MIPRWLVLDAFRNSKSGLLTISAINDVVLIAVQAPQIGLRAS